MKAPIFVRSFSEEERERLEAGLRSKDAFSLRRSQMLLSDAIVANRTPGSLAAQLPPLEPLAMKWTGLMDGDRTVAAYLKLNHAQNWGSFH